MQIAKIALSFSCWIACRVDKLIKRGPFSAIFINHRYQVLFDLFGHLNGELPDRSHQGQSLRLKLCEVVILSDFDKLSHFRLPIFTDVLYLVECFHVLRHLLHVLRELEKQVNALLALLALTF